MTGTIRPSGVVTWLTWAALGALAILVGAGALGIVGSADQLTELLPALAPNEGQLTAVAVAIALCVEALLVVTGLLVGFIRADRIFRPSALRLVDALVVTVLLATALVVIALFFIPGPPQLFLLVEAAVPAGATVTLVLVVMRSLLRRAIALHVELDGVV